MKLVNPNTGKPYRRGDLSPDGKRRFWKHKTNHLNKDGYFSTSWKSVEDYPLAVQVQKKKQQEQSLKNRKSKLPRRLNPKTGLPFVMGDQREDGYRFASYSSSGRVSGGFMGELWMAEGPYLRYRISLTLGKLIKRASKSKLPLDIDIDYLVNIFPANSLCPILGIKMEFGGDRENSPSIDRLEPADGYVVGNVSWVSKSANTLKSDLTSKELRQIADWIENQPVWQKHRGT